MTPDGLVSIVIPVFNRAAFLREAVASALMQTYRPIEIVIVDDGSTDDTGTTILELERQHSEVRSVFRANAGPAQARESGRLAARGSFIQYLDSDDLILPHKLELQVAALLRDREAGIAYCRTRYRGSAGEIVECTWKKALDGETTLFPYFLRGRLWETVTPLYRTAVTDRMGPWSHLRLEEDWEYDCRAGALGIRLVFVPEFLAEHRDAAPDRLSRGAALDPSRLVQRSAAHTLIYQHARSARITLECQEMRHFARELFLLSRQTGAADLPERSKELFALAREASGNERNRAQFRLYRAAAETLGWSLTGRLACLSDRLRR
jgi:glycosyltransferase involved in cell wall biosynthesis